MPNVVVNACYGGFGLSEAAVRRLYEMNNPYITVMPADQKNRKMLGYDNVALVTDDTIAMYQDDREGRAEPTLVALVKEMGKTSFGSFAQLKIVKVPDDVEWTIEEYDGSEWVAEKHRTWS